MIFSPEIPFIAIFLPRRGRTDSLAEVFIININKIEHCEIEFSNSREVFVNFSLLNNNKNYNNNSSNSQ